MNFIVVVGKNGICYVVVGARFGSVCGIVNCLVLYYSDFTFLFGEMF